MSERFWKATRPDGTDFYSGTVDYAAALASGQPVTIPEVDNPRCCAATVLHAATVPTETLAGGWWPCRLFEVTGTPVAEVGHKRGFFSLTVVREVDAHLVFGPQGEHVAALIDQAVRLDRQEASSLRRAAMHTPMYTARRAARDAAMGAARAIPWDAAWDTTVALVVRDLIGQHGFTQEHYDILTRPWRTVIGPIHPDDKDLKGQNDE